MCHLDLFGLLFQIFSTQILRNYNQNSLAFQFHKKNSFLTFPVLTLFYYVQVKRTLLVRPLTSLSVINFLLRVFLMEISAVFHANSCGQVIKDLGNLAQENIQYVSRHLPTLFFQRSGIYIYIYLCIFTYISMNQGNDTYVSYKKITPQLIMILSL